jgi:hypothetical protein
MTHNDPFPYKNLIDLPQVTLYNAPYVGQRGLLFQYTLEARCTPGE